MACETHKREYCRSYFELLHHAVRFATEDYGNEDWLRCIAGFETMPIYYCGSQCPDLVIIDTKTNPVYLLSRVCQPGSWVNLRFLPLVVGHFLNESCEYEPSLYHQYR